MVSSPDTTTLTGEPVNRRPRGKRVKAREAEPFEVPASETFGANQSRYQRILHETEQRNFAILRAIPDFMFIQSEDGVYLDFHANDPSVLLVPPERFLGRKMSEVLPPELASAFLSRFKQAIETGDTQLLEYDLEIAGELKTFEARVARCNGNRILSIVRDISERKREHNALIDSEEFNRRIVESSMDCIKILDLDGNLVYMSSNGQRLLEISDIEAFLGTSWIEMWGEEGRQAARDAVERARNGEVGSFQGFGATVKGKPKWWDNVITPMRGARGNIERLLAVSRDVSEHKLALDAVQASEAHFAKAFIANPQPMSLTTLSDGRYVDVNESFLSMSGYARDDVIGHTSRELHIWETDAHRDKLLINPLSKSGGVRNFEMRFRTKSGKFRTLLSSAELLEIGGNTCILVASSDITERKSLEENLRLSEREFSTLVQNSPDIISRLDRNLRYIYISPMVEQSTGVSTDRFVGRTPGEVAIEGYDWKGFEECCRQAILERKTITRAVEFQGRHYWTRIVPEYARDGSVESLMSISQDVTHRIRAEDELSQLSVELLNLQDEERRRIARELHDVTAQNLFAISVNLAKLSQLDSGDTGEAQQLVKECQTLGDQSLQEIRTLSYLLHPPLLDQAGLVSALRWFAEGFSKRSGIFVDVIAQSIGRLPSEVEIALFRIVQEALTNVRHHSGSDTANIRLEMGTGEIVLEITDKGHGLPHQTDGDSASHIGMGVGIPGMRQRLRQLGGRLEIVSTDTGTTVTAVVPVASVAKGASHGAHSHS